MGRLLGHLTIDPVDDAPFDTPTSTFNRRYISTGVHVWSFQFRECIRARSSDVHVAPPYCRVSWARSTSEGLK